MTTGVKELGGHSDSCRCRLRILGVQWWQWHSPGSTETPETGQCECRVEQGCIQPSAKSRRGQFCADVLFYCPKGLEEELDMKDRVIKKLQDQVKTLTKTIEKGGKVRFTV